MFLARAAAIDLDLLCSTKFCTHEFVLHVKHAVHSLTGGKDDVVFAGGVEAADGADKAVALNKGR